MKIIITGLISLFFLSCTAENFNYLVDLRGYWKFNIWDDMEWAGKNIDDTDWDRIHVPSKWEDQGYNEYNGYAWYRKTFIIPYVPDQQPVYITLGNIDDVDEVYFNGEKIGGYGTFPPHFETAYNVNRIYRIPRHLIKSDIENTIAVRVFDSYLDGGIVNGKIGVCVNMDNEYLDKDLSGTWKFKAGNQDEWKGYSFNDNEWNDIEVPDYWESQGYDNLDGYAWYRKSFYLPPDLNDDDLYLTLGKIDDIDIVYLNGELIGTVYELNKNDGRHFPEDYCNARRGYKIPNHLLNTDKKNTIAVKVYDSGGLGGISIGPVGLMKKRKFNMYINSYQRSGHLFKSIYDLLVQ